MVQMLPSKISVICHASHLPWMVCQPYMLASFRQRDTQTDGTVCEAQKYSFSSFRTFALSDFGQCTLGTFLWLAGQVGDDIADLKWTKWA